MSQSILVPGFLYWDGFKYVLNPGTFTPAGDLSGDAISQTVVGIENHPVPNPTGTGTVLTWNGSSFAWSVASGSGSTFVFIYRDSELSPTGNIFSTFAAAYAARSAAAGYAIILIDDTLHTCTVPPGSYNFNQTKLLGILKSGSSETSTLNVSDGVIFTNLRDIENLVVVPNNTSAPIVSLNAVNEHCILRNVNIISGGSVSKPFWNLTSSATLALTLLDESVLSSNAAIGGHVQTAMVDIGNDGEIHNTIALTMTGVNVGDLLLLITGGEADGETVTGCADDHGNAYTLINFDNSFSTGDYTLGAFYTRVAHVGAAGSLTITSTFDSNLNYRFMIVDEYALYGPLDVNSAIVQANPGPPSVSTPPTTNANDVLWSWGAMAGTSAFVGGTPGTLNPAVGYTERGHAVQAGVLTQDKFLSSAGAQTATVTQTGGSSNGGKVAYYAFEALAVPSIVSTDATSSVGIALFNNSSSTNAFLGVSGSVAQVGYDDTSTVIQNSFGGTLDSSFLSLAFKVGYTPNDPQDWAPVPNQAAAALDQLASNRTTYTQSLTNRGHGLKQSPTSYVAGQGDVLVSTTGTTPFFTQYCAYDPTVFISSTTATGPFLWVNRSGTGDVARLDFGSQVGGVANVITTSFDDYVTGGATGIVTDGYYGIVVSANQAIISRVGPDPIEVLNVIPLPFSHFYRVVYDPVNLRFIFISYVTSSSQITFYTFTPATCVFSSPIVVSLSLSYQLGDSEYSSSIIYAQGFLWASGFDNTGDNGHIFQFNTSNFTIVHDYSLSGPYTTSDLESDPQDGFLFAMCHVDVGIIFRINVIAQTVTSVYEDSGEPILVAYAGTSPGTGVLYIIGPNFNPTISRLTNITGSLTLGDALTFDPVYNLNSMVYNLFDGRLYITDSVQDALLWLDPTSSTISLNTYSHLTGLGSWKSLGNWNSGLSGRVGSTVVGPNTPITSALLPNLPVSGTIGSTPGSLIPVDATATGFTLNLPSSPSNGDTYTVIDVTGSLSLAKVVTIAGNGHNILGNPTFAMNVAWQSETLVFKSLQNVWVIK